MKVSKAKVNLNLLKNVKIWRSTITSHKHNKGKKEGLLVLAKKHPLVKHSIASV